MHCLTVEVGGVAIFVIVRTCVRVLTLPSEHSHICQVLHVPVCAFAFVSEPLLFRPLPCPPVLCHVYPVFVSMLHDDMVYVFLPSCFACSVSSVWSAPQCPAPICPHSAPPYCELICDTVWCFCLHACYAITIAMLAQALQEVCACLPLHGYTYTHINKYIYIYICTCRLASCLLPA